jgi:hypothetical protein
MTIYQKLAVAAWLVAIVASCTTVYVDARGAVVRIDATMEAHIDDLAQ